MTKSELVKLTKAKNRKVTQKIHHSFKKDKIILKQEIEQYKDIDEFFKGKANKIYKKYRYMQYNCLRKVAEYEKLPIYVMMNDQNEIPFCSQQKHKNELVLKQKLLQFQIFAEIQRRNHNRDTRNEIMSFSVESQ